MMDVPDIVAAFQFNNTVINSQAFTSLIQLLSKSPNDNAAKNCLYKSFYEFGDEISNWSMKAVPTLLKNDVIKSGNLVEECISRLGANDTFNHRLISIIVSLKLDDELRVLLSMTKKGDNVVKLLLKNAQNIDISRQIPYFKALILCQDVQGSTRDVVFQLLKRICETKPELSWFLKRTDNSYNSNSSELDWSDPFNISEKLHLEPELLISEKFPSSYTLFPTILSLFKAWSDLNKVCPEMLTTTILNNAKNLLAKSMVVSLKDYGDTGSKRVFNSYNMLQLIVAEGANGYVNCWMKFLETRNQLPFGEEAMLFAASLIPFGEASSVFFILDEIVKASPFLANTMLNFYMMLYTKPHCQVDSLTILKSIKHLVCSKYAVDSVTKFMILISSKYDEKGKAAMQYLSELVLDFPHIIDMVLPVVNVQLNDDEERQEQRLLILQNMILVSGRSEELLPKLTVCLKLNGKILAIAIKVLATIAEEEELSLPALRGQLAEKVREPKNEVALAEYCYLLTQCKNMDDEDEKPLRNDYIKEIWALREYKKGQDSSEVTLVRSSAWKALATLSVQEVLDVCAVTSCSLLLYGRELLGEELSSFMIFLAGVARTEVEAVPRPVYTKTYDIADPILSNVSSWFDILCRTNPESPWMWKATLCTASYLVFSCSVDKRRTYTFKLIRRLFCEIPENKLFSTDSALEQLGSWRLFIKEAVKILASESSNDYIWARDQICEEGSKSLRQSELCLPNIILALTALVLEMQSISMKSSSEQRKVLDISMRPWLISVCQFIIPLTDTSDSELKAKSNPLFQISVKSTVYSSEMAKFCDWILCRSTVGPRYNETPSFSIKNGYDPYVMDDLTITCIESILTDSSHLYLGSRCSLWSYGAAFGISPLHLSDIDDSIMDEKEKVERIIQILDIENAYLTPEHITELLTTFSNLSKFNKAGSKSGIKRKLERAWGNGEDYKQAIYEGLAVYCRSTWLQINESLPANYGYLPDGSFLKEMISIIISAPSSEFSKSLLGILTPIKRSDGRTLPPLDWPTVVGPLIHQSDTANVLIKLGVQEKCRMLIYKLSNPKLSLSQNGEDFFMSYITDLSFVTSCLSQERVDHLLENLLNFGVRNASKKREILEAISGCLDIMTVDNYIEKLLPTFECFDNESVFVNLVSQLNFGSEFEGRVNLTFDFFIESRKGVDINLSQLLLLFEAANQSDICLRIFGYNMFINDLSTIIHVMMNLVSVHNLHTSNGSYKVDTFLFFLVLVCAFPVQLPFPWVGKENTKEILLKRWSYFWDKGFLPSLPSKSTAVMQRFLLSHLSNYDDGKVTPIIREMLISLFGRSETTIDDVLKMDNKERHLLFLCESS